jgi:hypothetical protein
VLAFTAVLLAVMSLSQQAFVDETPSNQATPSRPRSNGGLVNGETPAALPGEFADQRLWSEVRSNEGRSSPSDLAMMDESPGGRAGDAGYSMAIEAGKLEKEIDGPVPRDSGESFTEEKSNSPAGSDLSRVEPLAVPGKREDRQPAWSAQEAHAATPAISRESDRNRVRQKKDDFERDNDDLLEMSQALHPEAEETVSTDQAAFRVPSPPGARQQRLPLAQTELAGVKDQSLPLDFMAHYQRTDNLRFQPATGYWENTHVPGDPEIRLLRARLAAQDRSWLQHNGLLEQAVQTQQQPFDAPANNALALSLMADASAIAQGEDGPTRMRLQVGIRAIENRMGQRPAMNVGVVLDLPADAPDELRIASRSLLDALLHSQQVGDRFSLVMSHSGLVIEPGDFRFGSLQLARDQILDTEHPLEETGPGKTGMSLQAALQRAAMMVEQNDDPGRPLGSSSILLISAVRRGK